MKAFRFEVAFSFAGAHREQVRAIAELVSAALDPGITERSKGRVFFDEWFAHEILGDDMDVLLQRFYHRQSRMVVADLSDDYAGRPWCQAETRTIRALRFDIDPARDETGRLRLLNLKLGEGDVPVADFEGRSAIWEITMLSAHDRHPGRIQSNFSSAFGNPGIANGWEATQ